MDRVITEIDQSAYLRGELLGAALFKYGSSELIDSYNVMVNSQKSQATQEPGSFLEGLAIITGALQSLNQLNNDHEKLLQNLKSEILNLIKGGELIPFGFKEPRDISDKPIKIPADLFFSGQINWEISELKYKAHEFSGVRLLKNISPVIELTPETQTNKNSQNLKPEKLNFSELEEDRYIDEKLASEFLGIAVKTLQGYRVKGGGPEFRKIGAKTVRYKFSDLKNWAESRKKQNTSQY